MKKVLLNEETEGVKDFLETIIKKHPEVKDFYDVLLKFIEESECKRINFSKFKMGVLGLALSSGVLINENVLNMNLTMMLFIIFHEIAHQYQFKKYGAEKMYDVYKNEMSLDDAAEMMKKIEMVADEFAARKVRQLNKMGFLDKNFVVPSYSKNMTNYQLKSMISHYRNQINMGELKTPKEISEYFYNMIKSNI